MLRGRRVPAILVARSCPPSGRTRLAASTSKRGSNRCTPGSAPGPVSASWRFTIWTAMPGGWRLRGQTRTRCPVGCALQTAVMERAATCVSIPWLAVARVGSRILSSIKLSMVLPWPGPNTLKLHLPSARYHHSRRPIEDDDQHPFIVEVAPHRRGLGLAVGQDEIG